MNKIQCTIYELGNMLVTTEETLKSLRGILLIMEQTSSKWKSIGKKKKFMKKQKVESKKKEKKVVPKKKIVKKKKCFHNDKDGHWKWSCPAYLTSLKNKRKDGFSKDMLFIETNLMICSTSNWVIDSESSAYLCIYLQDLDDSRRLREGEMTLYVGNRAKVVTVAVEIYPIHLPLENILFLRDYYFVPTASRNLIFVSYLTQDDYVISFYKDHCNIYFENNKIESSFLINNLFQLHVDVSINYIEQNMNVIGNKRSRDIIN